MKHKEYFILLIIVTVALLSVVGILLYDLLRIDAAKERIIDQEIGLNQAIKEKTDDITTLSNNSSIVNITEPVAFYMKHDSLEGEE